MNELKKEIELFAAIRESRKKPVAIEVNIPLRVNAGRVHRTPEEQAALETNLSRDSQLFSMAAYGLKFKAGRKLSAGSIIREKISSLLKKKPQLKNPELWKAVSEKLPRGWAAYDNNIGKYLEGNNTGQNMSYARFCNVCGEERKRINQ